MCADAGVAFLSFLAVRPGLFGPWGDESRQYVDRHGTLWVELERR